MNKIALAAFFDELEKIAYGATEHTALADTAAKGMTPRPSPFMRKGMTKGTVGADKGIRGPKMPWTDQVHAFGASQTRQQMGKNVASRQQGAVKDIANSIGDRSLKGRLLSGARAQRGVKEMGLANHQLTDISAHNDTAPHSPIRKKTPNTGYGGQVAAAKEHAQAGLKGSKLNPESHLDELRPKERASSRQAIGRSAGQGRAARRQIEARLVSQGMTPEQAAAKTEKFLTKAHAPSLPSRVVGEASRASRFVRGESRRAASTAAGVPGRFLRRVIRR